MIKTFVLFSVAALALFANSLAAQALDNRWVEFADETATRLIAAVALSTGDPDEKDYGWGDLDRDGDIDLICVRKQPFSSAGKRVNVLFMNEGLKEGHSLDGVLVDRTTTYAINSATVGDFGFNTPTNDRDVAVADFNNDGWLDFVTAVTISDGDPKYLSHPRVYMNRGANVNGAWLGFRFDEARSPQLYTINTNGTANTANPVAGRFCSVAAGDVTGDGYADIYLGDYDAGGGSSEIAANDTNDRLWVNQGAANPGHFSDSLRSRMSANMLLSAFAASSHILDLNNDGLNDVLKNTALQAPQNVSCIYDLPTQGIFDLLQVAHTNAPYFVMPGDLNNDNRPDIVVTDDGADRFRFNLSNDPLGQVAWSASYTFAFLSGADDGFGSQSSIEDLDNDGWRDVLISDVDVDIGGCARRLHIYHNAGNAPVNTMREERQSAASPLWIGAVGFTATNLQGTYHVAPIDLNGDGWLDVVSGRCSTMHVMMNKPIGLVSSGNGTPSCKGIVTMSGNMKPKVNTPAFALTSSKCPPNTVGYVAISAVANAAGSDPLGIGVTFYVDPVDPSTLLVPVLSDANGRAAFAIGLPNVSALAGMTFKVQSFWPLNTMTQPNGSPCVPPNAINWGSSQLLSLTIQP
ncbi:MAG: VCBS repeat-containing protein [Planctomycetes bacterium]|nr:VCBS repeat-containing protein [Planctomycetota bacterium]